MQVELEPDEAQIYIADNFIEMAKFFRVRNDVKSTGRH